MSDDILKEIEVLSSEDRIMEAVQSDLLGVKPSILGKKLRPVKLASIALLQKTNNEIVSGKPMEECANLILDSCKFVVLQSVPLREAIKLTENLDELEMRAYELAEDIAPAEMPAFQQMVIDLIQTAQETRVEPVEQKAPKSELGVEVLGE
jgi:hypothetical protein